MYVKKLGLLYNGSKIITAGNCRFWDDFDLEKDFPGEGKLRMATLPRAILFGQGAVVPQSFDELLNSVESAIAKPLILNGKPLPGVADALRALKKNEFHSFFGKSKKYGADKNVFHKDFKKLIEKPPFYPNMMVEEMNCTSSSPNGLLHSNLFIDKLNQALRYARIGCPSKYEEAVDKYVTPAKKVTRKVKFCQQHDDDVFIDSDDYTPPRKRGKKEDSDTDYMGRYYKFILGLDVNENDRGPLQWIQRDHMHSLFTKLRGNCKYISELQGLQVKWDRVLRSTCSEIYLQVAEKLLIWNHVFVKKI